MFGFLLIYLGVIATTCTEYPEHCVFVHLCRYLLSWPSDLFPALVHSLKYFPPQWKLDWITEILNYRVAFTVALFGATMLATFS